MKTLLKSVLSGALIASAVLLGGSKQYTLGSRSFAKTAVVVTGNPTRVNQGAWGSVSSGGAGTTTQSTGWNGSAGDFFFIMMAGDSGGGTFHGATANVGATPYTMTQALIFNGHQVVGAYYLDNAPAGIDSVTFTNSSWQTNSFVVAEYSGVAATASIVATPVTGTSGFVYETAWATSTYTAPSGTLLFSGTIGANYSSTVWAAGTGWAMVSNYAVGTAPFLMLEQQITVGSGSFTGGGTWDVGANGTYYDSFIVGFK